MLICFFLCSSIYVRSIRFEKKNYKCTIILCININYLIFFQGDSDATMSHIKKKIKQKITKKIQSWQMKRGHHIAASQLAAVVSSVPLSIRMVIIMQQKHSITNNQPPPPHIIHPLLNSIILLPWLHKYSVYHGYIDVEQNVCRQNQQNWQNVGRWYRMNNNEYIYTYIVG